MEVNGRRFLEPHGLRGVRPEKQGAEKNVQHRGNSICQDLAARELRELRITSPGA